MAFVKVLGPDLGGQAQTGRRAGAQGGVHRDGTARGREVVGGGGRGVAGTWRLARATRQHALGPAWPISGRAIAPVSRSQSGQMTDGG